MSFNLRPFFQNRLTRTFSTSSFRLRTFARINILGRLADRPQIVPTSTATEVVRYSLATESMRQQEKQTNWWKISAFLKEGPQKDFVLGLGKGSLIHLEADASLRRYENQKGDILTAIDLVHRRLELLERKGPISEGEEYSEEHSQVHSEGHSEEYSEGHSEETSEESSKEHGKESSGN